MRHGEHGATLWDQRVGLEQAWLSTFGVLLLQLVETVLNVAFLSSGLYEGTGDARRRGSVVHGQYARETPVWGYIIRGPGEFPPSLEALSSHSHVCVQI